MMNTTLEEITRTLVTSDGSLEGSVYAKWFDTECVLFIEDCTDLEDSPEQKQTLLGFLNWSDDLKMSLIEATKRYCVHFCDWVGEEPPNDYNSVSILDDCELLVVMVLPPYQGHRYMRMELNCAWE